MFGLRLKVSDLKVEKVIVDKLISQFGLVIFLQRLLPPKTIIEMKQTLSE